MEIKLTINDKKSRYNLKYWDTVEGAKRRYIKMMWNIERWNEKEALKAIEKVEAGDMEIDLNYFKNIKWENEND